MDWGSRGLSGSLGSQVSEHIPSPTKASTMGFLFSFSFVRFLLEYSFLPCLRMTFPHFFRTVQTLNYGEKRSEKG